MQPFLALITPVSDAGGGGGGSPPQVNWPTFPSNPIAEPPWGWGARPPQVNYPTFPSNPIAKPPWGWGQPNPPPGGSPPVISGGPIDPYPDIGFPGPQPGGPVHIWGGPYFPPIVNWPTFPSNPITNPGDPNNPAEGQPGGNRTPKIEWKTAWSPSTGWIVVGVPTGEHVTPSQGESGSEPK